MTNSLFSFISRHRTDKCSGHFEMFWLSYNVAMHQYVRRKNFVCWCVWDVWIFMLWICVCHWPQIVQIAKIAAFRTWMQRSGATNSNSMRNQSTYIAFIRLVFFLLFWCWFYSFRVCVYKCATLFNAHEMWGKYMYVIWLHNFLSFLLSFYAIYFLILFFFRIFIQYFYFSWKFILLFLM